MIHQPIVRCVEFVESVTDWVEDALTNGDRVTIEEHLVICPHCTEYLVQLRVATELVQEHPAEPPPAAVRNALLAAFRIARGGEQLPVYVTMRSRWPG